MLRRAGAGSTPLPQGFDLNAVWGTTESDLWLVGYGGTILHWQDGAITQVKSSTTANLHSIWGSGPRDIWIVGDKGTLLHSDGGCFSPVASGTGVLLRSVFGVAPDDIWAVGDRGTMLHYDGKSWLPIDSLGSGTLVSVWGSSARDFWFVDQNPSSVLRFDGQRLTRTPVPKYLYAVSGSGPNDVWFVGKGLPSTALAWRFDGSSYQEIKFPASEASKGLAAVSVRGASDVLAAGDNGALLKYDGATWTPVPGSKSEVGAHYNGLWRGSGTSARLVGVSGFIGRVDGSGLTKVSQDLTGGSTLQAIWASGPNDLWAVGRNGVILRWDGRSVVRHHSGVTDDLRAVWGSTPDDVWAVGGVSSGPLTSCVLHWDGSSWSKVSHTPAQQLATVWGSSSKDVWIGGVGGAMFHWDGSTLSPVTTGTTFEYRALSGTGTDAVWSLRYDGFIHRYDGTSWAPIASPMPPITLTSLWAGGPSDLWLGGFGGFLSHFDGTSWKQEPDSPELGGNIVALWGSKRTDVWAVLNYGTNEDPRESLSRYDGTRWTKAVPGMGWFPSTLYGAGSSVWVAGDFSYGTRGALIQVQR